MQTKYAQVLAGMRNGSRFLDENWALLPQVNAAGGRSKWDQVVARLAELGMRQDAHRMSARGGLTHEQKAARDLRRKYMIPTVRLARALVPAASQLAAVSVPRLRSNSTLLATQARALAESVAPYRQILHEGGLPASFVEDLNAAAKALEDAVAQKKLHQVGRVGATENIDFEVNEARVQVQVIDGMVAAALSDGHPELQEWNQIIREIRAAFRRVLRPRAGQQQPSGDTPAGVIPFPVEAAKAA